MRARQAAAGAEEAAEAWRARAEALAETEDALLAEECALKTRLWHWSLEEPLRREHFGLLCARLRRHFGLLRVQGSEAELREAFEEAVGDWGRLCEAAECGVGWEETAQQRTQRLAEVARLAEMLFGGLEQPLTPLFAAHAASPAFAEFLRDEFGNAEVLRCLEEGSETEGVRRAVEAEELLTPFVAELREALGEALTRSAAPVSVEGTLAALIEAARPAQDFAPVLAYLGGLGLEGVEPPAQPDLPGWKSALEQSQRACPAAAGLLRALRTIDCAATQAP